MDRTNAECGRPGRASPCRTAWGSKSGRARAPRCPEAVIAFRGTVGGDKGDWESNFHWILRAFPIYDQYEQVRDHVGDFIGHIERDKCYRAGRDRDYRRRPLARRRAGSARGLFRSAHPPRLRLRSLDGDRILFGQSPEPGSQRAGIEDRARLRIRRSPRLRPPDHAALHPLVALAIRGSSASASGSFKALQSPCTA